MLFYTGAHHSGWLESVGVPLFVSHRRLVGRKTLPVAAATWALDSGAFTEVTRFGGFTTSAQAYAIAVRRYADEIGKLDFAAPQDWMCEPVALAATGLTLVEHQRRTVASYLELCTLDATLPFIPVLQGQSLDDYLQCVDLYEAAGVDLPSLPTVGVGSVCRRQHTGEIDTIVTRLCRLGLNLHGFGVKTDGLAHYSWALASADSLAWSYSARRDPPMPGHTHKNCANCWPYARDWRVRVLASATGHEQLTLEGAA